jgi:hypothetical protein
MSPHSDVTTFVKRYYSLVEGDTESPMVTDAGNPQPALFDVRLAYLDGCRRSLPKSFYLSLNSTFVQLSEAIVAFPTEMFDQEDICIMDRSLFEGLLDGTVVDDEAQLPIDEATSPILNHIREVLRHPEGVAHG